MEAASDEFEMNLPDKKGQAKKYKEGVSKPWSRWDYDTYFNFQEELRKKVKPTMCPMEWEAPAWLEIKKKREEKVKSMNKTPS